MIPEQVPIHLYAEALIFRSSFLSQLWEIWLSFVFHKYNVPNFSPFSITRAPLVTFQVLSVKVVTQPSSPNCLVEIRFFFRSGTCLTSFNNHLFPFYWFTRTLPIQTIYKVYHHTNEPIQNILEHSHENYSYQVWHGIIPLNLPPRN